MTMPHRGRLNVLVNLLNYPLEDLIAKIQGRSDIPESIYTSTDDVVSHIACSNGISDKLNVSLLHNPSHLETSNAVS
jgi:probable 2-oxoglutarate dehydrogenase E1 component DHKTD1